MDTLAYMTGKGEFVLLSAPLERYTRADLDGLSGQRGLFLTGLVVGL